MDALGMIETRGLIAAIEACDVMLKTANVRLIGKRKSTATLVAILVTGDVGAVKASVEAGAAAAEKVSPGSLLTAHVIPRPINDIDCVFGPESPKEPNEKSPASESTDIPPVEVNSQEKVVEKDKVVKNEKKAMLTKKGDTVRGAALDAADLKDLSVVQLRQLARKFTDLGISGRQISKANKKVLLNHLLKHFNS